MNSKQKAILIGMVLGDSYLQKTGEQNARIRLEQSLKQRDYLQWKAQWFPEFFQGKPQELKRYNPVYKKTYEYIRWQSNASPEIGRYRKIFYQDGKKNIPEQLSSLLVHPISLALWFMDDGYLYYRDKMAYIYIPKLTNKEVEILVKTLKQNFGLTPVIKLKKKGNRVLVFSVQETKKLLALIAQYIIPSMQHKLFNPVSTEA